ncbi:MAG TPA: MFS transporter [Gaiellaceae bacterium]|nr:MFS transporter [Gaiellaceae bacterium]
MEAPLRRNREFVALWVGQAVSNLGIGISSFAYPLVVLAATGSALRAGTVGTVLAATAFVLRLPAGALVDRLPRKRVLVLCDLGRAVNSGGLAAALALGHFWYAHVLAVAFVEAALGVLFGPAETAAVRRVVGPERVREAVAANASRASLPGVIGPPLGGVLLAGGRALPFVADAASYAASLACVLTVRTPLGPDRPAAAPASRPVAQVFDGIRWLLRDPFLRTILFLFMWFGLALGSIGLVLLVLARDTGAGPGEIGLMYAITGAGSVLGAFATRRLTRRAPPYVLVLLFAWLAAGATCSLVLLDSAIAFGFVGAVPFFFVPPLNAVLFGRIAERAPDELQGRATSAAIQLASLLAPVGPVAAGALIGAVGPEHTALAYGALIGVIALFATLTPALRAEPA